MRVLRNTASIIVVATACFALADAAFAQFGKGLLKSKTEVTMVRTKPPKVVVTGSAIKVEALTRVGRTEVLRPFRLAIEAQLVANDDRVKIGSPEPDTLVRCTITRLDVNQTAGSRVVSAYKQTGTKQELNKKTGKMDTVPVYENVAETQHFTTVRGDMRVEVRVRIVKTNALIVSRAYVPAFNREYAANVKVPQREEVEAALFASGARAAAAEVTPSSTSITVMMGRPDDDVDDRNKLAEEGLWVKLAEQLEAMKPLKDPKKDAYRLFNIGVATEAQAYQAKDLAATQKFLERAAAMYAQALQQKPDEEYFQPPIARVTDSIGLYKEFERQQTLIASGGALPDLMPPGAADPPATAAASDTPDKPMSNKDVIDLVQAGLSEENLLAAIKDAKTAKFDLTVEGLKELLAAKVPNTVVAAMREKKL